jgi:hypothetical protein
MKAIPTIDAAREAIVADVIAGAIASYRAARLRYDRVNRQISDDDTLDRWSSLAHEERSAAEHSLIRAILTLHHPDVGDRIICDGEKRHFPPCAISHEGSPMRPSRRTRMTSCRSANTRPVGISWCSSCSRRGPSGNLLRMWSDPAPCPALMS